MRLTIITKASGYLHHAAVLLNNPISIHAHLVYMSASPTISPVHPPRARSLDRRPARQAALELEHGTGDLITESHLPLVVVLLRGSGADVSLCRASGRGGGADITTRCAAEARHERATRSGAAGGFCVGVMHIERFRRTCVGVAGSALARLVERYCSLWKLPVGLFA